MIDRTAAVHASQAAVLLDAQGLWSLLGYSIRNGCVSSEPNPVGILYLTAGRNVAFE